jgi:hypothetical protein
MHCDLLFGCNVLPLRTDLKSTMCYNLAFIIYHRLSSYSGRAAQKGFETGRQIKAGVCAILRSNRKYIVIF